MHGKAGFRNKRNTWKYYIDFNEPNTKFFVKTSRIYRLKIHFPLSHGYLWYTVRLLSISLQPMRSTFSLGSKTPFTYIVLLAIKGFYRPWPHDWNRPTVFILYVRKRARGAWFEWCSQRTAVLSLFCKKENAPSNFIIHPTYRYFRNIPWNF